MRVHAWIPAAALAAALALPAVGASDNAVPTGSALVKALAPTLDMGDKAPPLRVMAWIRGEPVTTFKPGHVYIVDFWATWCGVCIEGMPHLSALQKKYAGKLTVIGVDAKEMAHAYGPIDVAQVKAKVEASARKHADRMTYTVAMDHPVDNTVFMTWQEASGGMRVPNAMIVDGNGRIVWNAPPTGKWQEQFDRAVAAAVGGKSDLALGREIFQKQYGDGVMSLRFAYKFDALLNTDEDAALRLTRAGFDEPAVRAAVSCNGSDAQYWGMIALHLSSKERLSPRLTALAVEYLEKFIAEERPAIPARSLALAGLYYRQGEQEKGAAAERRTIELFRASGSDEAQLAQISRTLDRYRGK